MHDVKDRALDRNLESLLQPLGCCCHRRQQRSRASGRVFIPIRICQRSFLLLKVYQNRLLLWKLNENLTLDMGVSCSWDPSFASSFASMSSSRFWHAAAASSTLTKPLDSFGHVYYVWGTNVHTANDTWLTRGSC